MRVGLVVYGSLGDRSGGFRYDRRLVAELRRVGDTVDVVELPWRSYPRGLADNLSGWVADSLPTDADVIVQDEIAHPSLLRANRSLSCPVVSIVHHLRASEPRPLAPLYRAIEHQYLATVDAAICNSTATRTLVTGAGVRPERTVVAPPAGDRFDPDIDDETITARARDGPLSITFVGNIAPRKGLDTLVDALADVEAACELTVVGGSVDDSYVASIREQVRDLGLRDRVTMTGALSDTALAERLRQSHVLAVPSRYEGFGIVYLEGMSFGLPAIATRAGGASDVVSHGENGILVDPDEPSVVASALTTLARDRDRLAELGLAARQRYESHPGWEETATRVRDMLVTVAETPGVSA